MKSVAKKTSRLKADLRLREAGATFTYDATGAFSHSTITYKGETLSIKDWSAKLGLNYSGVRDRLVKGWTIADAVAYAKNVARPAKEKSKHTKIFNVLS